MERSDVSAKDLYFNSIKVQLKHRGHSRCSLRPEFQFHKGTIKAYKRPHIGGYGFGFQFHKGTIKATCRRK